MPKSSSLQFDADDRWAAIGDSITQPGLYQLFVYLYYLTRFPKRKLTLINGGISGDTAARVLKRLDKDVLVNKPTVATILLGANDMVGDLYKADQPDAEIQAKRDQAKQTYQTDMRQLLERIEKTGTRIILMTPTIYDETMVHRDAVIGNKGFNGALDWCAEFVTSLAAEFGAGVIDIHTPLCRWAAQLQKADPEFTLTCLDRMHLCETGHFVLAYEFLKAQGAARLVSRITLDAKTGQTRDLVNVRVQNIQRGDKSIELDCLNSALPYPVPTSCKAALEFLPFVWELNQETLQIDNLPIGNYELRIDGNIIATYSNEQFRQGVNLAMESATPQFQQAQAVLQLATRHLQAYKPLRCMAEMECCFLAEYAGDFSNMAAVKTFLFEQIEKAKGQPWYDYCKGQAANYVENKPREKEFRAQLRSLEKDIARKNTPVCHHYAIAAV